MQPTNILPATLPIADLHGDLLSYLAYVKGASAYNSQAIGCALPHLQAGNVRLQVLAMFTPQPPDVPNFTLLQARLYRQLLSDNTDCARACSAGIQLSDKCLQGKTIFISAIENAAGFWAGQQTPAQGLQNLEEIIEIAGRPLYIGLTHAGANHFGGGNGSKTGLLKNGEALLDFMSSKSIAIDLAHTSDALAFDILNYIEKHNLKLPVLASHSNFRTVQNHVRNLPDELVQEIIRRKGLIGLNFLKHMLGNKPDRLTKHILYGIENGAEDALCFGADYYHNAAVAAGLEEPVFYEEHAHAGKYPVLLQQTASVINDQALQKLSYANAERFIAELWHSTLSDAVF